MQTASIGTLDGAVPPNFASTKNSWSYGYNKRRLLTQETLALDNKSFALNWRYNPRGDQEGLVYPSGLDISFLPNAYGEPRQAGAFASSVTRHPNGAINSLNYGQSSDTQASDLKCQRPKIRWHFHISLSSPLKIPAKTNQKPTPPAANAAKK